MEIIKINDGYIQINQLLKKIGVIDTGGQIIYLLNNKDIMINNQLVVERRKKVFSGDEVFIKGIGLYKIIREDE